MITEEDTLVDFPLKVTFILQEEPTRADIPNRVAHIAFMIREEDFLGQSREINNMHNDIISLFVESSTGWDHVDSFNIQLYNAVLKVDIGPYKAGQTVDCISFLLLEVDQTRLQIYRKDGTYHEQNINFSFTLSEV